MAKGEEIFSKEALSIKALKKMDKDELVSTIEINLEALVDYYYSEIHHKEERAYRKTLVDLVINKKLFLKPLMRILKDNPEEVPSGLAFIIYDSLNIAQQSLKETMDAETASNKPKEEIDANIGELVKYFNDVRNDVHEVLIMLSAKNFKKLKKLGMKKIYAAQLAPALIDSNYMTNKNLFRFVRLFTKEIYHVVSLATLVNQDQSLVNDLGIDLTNKKTMNSFMNIITKNMDLGTFGEFIKQLLLEKRDKDFDGMTQPQLAVYSAITTWCLNSLEDKEIFGNKSRQEIIKSYGIQIQRDIKRGRDAKRRVVFSELDADMYPRIVKALKAVTAKEE